MGHPVDQRTSPASSGLPVTPRCRVVVDNDFAGDPDGLLALAHHLLSPAERVDLVTSSFLNPVFTSPLSAAVHGARMATDLLELLDLGGVPVAAGADQALDAGDASSPAADAIVEQALRDDPLPLVLVCAGPLTNVAQALHQEPGIAGRLTLVWVGGSVEAGAGEYNRDTDPAAAELVLGVRDLAVLQVPLELYRRCVVPVAELQLELTARGPVGQWLWDRFVALVASLPEGFPVPSAWALGDSLPLLVTSLTHPGGPSAPGAGEPGRGGRVVLADADVRLLLADLLARLELQHRT